MKYIALMGAMVAIFSSATLVNAVEPSPAPSPTPSPQITSPNTGVPYLGVDGTFTLDTSVPSARRDPRNPARIVFSKMQQFSFYRDLAGQEPLAENCPYIYKGAAPDRFYYPKSPKSIWDLFELAPGNENCSAFKYVALRAPHGEPVHMHLRYGGESSSFETLLSMSNAEEDTAKLDPWWSVYCAEGKTACDQ